MRSRSSMTVSSLLRSASDLSLVMHAARVHKWIRSRSLVIKDRDHRRSPGASDIRSGIVTRSPPPYRRFETAVQLLPRASLSQTEADVRLHHHTYFHGGCHARRHRSHRGHFGHDRIRPRAAAESGRLGRAHSRQQRGRFARLAGSHGENPEHARGRRDGAVCARPRHRRVRDISDWPR